MHHHISHHLTFRHVVVIRKPLATTPPSWSNAYTLFVCLQRLSTWSLLEAGLLRALETDFAELAAYWLRVDFPKFAHVHLLHCAMEHAEKPQR